jgi:hypothetical protein
MNKLIRTIHPEVRIIDAAKGIVDYVASDETLDCYREIIRADGWRFTHFKKNSPFVDSHDYSSVGNLLGKVTDFKVDGKQLVERVQWAVDSNSELARLGFSLTAGGYLKAVSVGFFQNRTVTKWDSDPKAFQGAIKELGVSTEDAATLRAIYLEQEQIELSACILGANPNALAKAHIDGVATDETLEKLGFDDDGLQFLHESAAAYDEATPAQRAFIKLEMRRFTCRSTRQSIPRTKTTTDTTEHEGRDHSDLGDRSASSSNNFRKEAKQRATSSNDGADDEAAIQRRRRAFLAELNAATKQK